MRLTASPSEVRPPYACVFCGGTEGLIDSLYELDAYPGYEKNGALYICSPCTADAAQQIGWVAGERYIAAVNEAEAYNVENLILREKHLEDTDKVIAAVIERLDSQKVNAVPAKPVAKPVRRTA